MRTKMKWLAAIGMIMILLLTVCAATAEGVSETLQVSISTKGTPPETPETYTVRLTADGDFPMPAGYQTGENGKYADGSKEEAGHRGVARQSAGHYPLSRKGI